MSTVCKIIHQLSLSKVVKLTVQNLGVLNNTKCQNLGVLQHPQIDGCLRACSHRNLRDGRFGEWAYLGGCPHLDAGFLIIRAWLPYAGPTA
jgi:hypothetical protein